MARQIVVASVPHLEKKENDGATQAERHRYIYRLRGNYRSTLVTLSLQAKGMQDETQSACIYGRNCREKRKTNKEVQRREVDLLQVAWAQFRRLESPK
jgi:hypothetical protein